MIPNFLPATALTLLEATVETHLLSLLAIKTCYLIISVPTCLLVLILSMGLTLWNMYGVLSKTG